MHTANSLARYIVEIRNVDALFKPLSDDYKTGWLRSIGVDREYIDPYDGYLDIYTVTGLNPLVVACSDASYRLDTYSWDRLPEFGFDTASRMENFLHREAHGKEYIINWLLENAGEQFQLVYYPLVRPITYNNDQSLYRSRVVGYRVYIRDVESSLHEYIHVILRGPVAWQFEGLAEFLSKIVYPYSYIKEYSEGWDYGLGANFFSREAEDEYEELLLERYRRYGE